MTIRSVNKQVFYQTLKVLSLSLKFPFLGGNEEEQKCKIKKRERL